MEDGKFKDPALQNIHRFCDFIFGRDINRNAFQYRLDGIVAAIFSALGSSFVLRTVQFLY
jgi:hypothetical protein